MNNTSERFYSESEDGDILPIDQFDDVPIKHQPPDYTEYMMVNAADQAAAEDRYAPFLEPAIPLETAETDVELDVVPEVSKKDRSERQFNLRDRFNFYASSLDELKFATYLTSSHDLPAGAASLLNKIYHRQKNKTTMEKPENTLYSITRGFINHIDNAKGEIAALSAVRDDIKNSEAHSFSSVENISTIKDWKHEGYTRRAIGDVTRLVDTDNFVNEDGRDNLNDNYLSSDPEMIGRLSHTVRTVRVGEFLNLIDARIAQHKARIEFWKQAVEQAEAHTIVRGMAHEALKRHFGDKSEA